MGGISVLMDVEPDEPGQAVSGHTRDELPDGAQLARVGPPAVSLSSIGSLDRLRMSLIVGTKRLRKLSVASLK
jgi:hypothetical protein